MSIFDKFKRTEPVVEQQKPKTKYKFIQVPAREITERQDATRGFNSGDASRYFGNWFQTDTSIDGILKSQLTSLRSRCRERMRNDDYAKGFLRDSVNNVVGPSGIELIPMTKRLNNQPDDLAQTILKDLWKKWGKKKDNVDITGRSNWLELQQQIMTFYLTDGEVFIRHIEGKEAGEWGYAVQVIDPEMCDTQFNETLTNGNEVIMGIEYNKWRKPLAYYFKTSNNNKIGTTYKNQGTNYIRVPANEIIHAFRRDFPDQTRGIPVLAPTLNRLKMLDSYEEAALINARYGAEVIGNYYREGDGFDVADEGIDGNLTQEVEPGVINILPDHWRFDKIDTKYPDGEMPEFVKHMLKSIAASLGIPYFMLAQDLSDVNFSTARVGLSEARQHWVALQNFMIDNILSPIFERWLFQQIMRGRLVVAGRTVNIQELERFSEVRWVPRKFGYVDPAKEATANKTLHELGVKSASTIAKELGLDYEIELMNILSEPYINVEPRLDDVELDEEDEEDQEG